MQLGTRPRPRPRFRSEPCNGGGGPSGKTAFERTTVEPMDSPRTTGREERLAAIVDRCLQSEAAYKLFERLDTIARLPVDERLAYVARVRDSGRYTEEEIHAVERLVVSGTASSFKEVIDQVRQERVQHEIQRLTGSRRRPARESS